LIDVVFGSGGSCRMVLIFHTAAALTGEVMQRLMTPFIEVKLQDELERDLSELAVRPRRAVRSSAASNKGACASEFLDDRQRWLPPRDAILVVP
jgi:hypothetical protein